MTIAAAIDALEAIAFSGITNYGLDETPQVAVESADLPALIINPYFPGRGGQWEALDVGLSAGVCVLWLEHLLLVTKVGLQRSEARYNAAVAHMDTYLSTIQANFMLSDTLLEPLTIPAISLGLVQ